LDHNDVTRDGSKGGEFLKTKRGEEDQTKSFFRKE
jgi:hypothetical protein